MDTTDWALLQSETGTISAPLLSSAHDSRHCSSSCQVHPVVSSYNGDIADRLYYKSHAAVLEDQSYVVQTPALLRGNRSRSGSAKPDIRKLSGGEAKLEVVFQKLNDAKKGIPEDGHRGWKKYGSKSIQNSNHCRGYYKCSVRECRAKKMVQRTDNDPTLFEVTYVGKHSCSSTEQRRRSSRACNPAPVEVREVQGKKKNARMEMEGSNGLTASTSVTENSIRETGRTGIIPGKRGRSLVEDNKATFDSFTYLPAMTILTTTSAPEEQGGSSAGDASMDTYLHQSSRHHQAVYCFQEPLLWDEFDMDTTLSTGPKSASMDSDSL